MARYLARAPISLPERDVRPGDAFESDTWDASDERAECLDAAPDDLAADPAPAEAAPAKRQRK